MPRKIVFLISRPQPLECKARACDVIVPEVMQRAMNVIMQRTINFYLIIFYFGMYFYPTVAT